MRKILSKEKWEQLTGIIEAINMGGVNVDAAIAVAVQQISTLDLSKFLEVAQDEESGAYSLVGAKGYNFQAAPTPFREEFYNKENGIGVNIYRLRAQHHTPQEET